MNDRIILPIVTKPADICELPWTGNYGTVGCADDDDYLLGVACYDYFLQETDRLKRATGWVLLHRHMFGEEISIQKAISFTKTDKDLKQIKNLRRVLGEEGLRKKSGD